MKRERGRRAVCQRSGLEYKISDMIKEERTGLWVAREHYDPEHPREHMHVFISKERSKLQFVNPPVNNDVSVVPAYELFSDGLNFFDTTRFTT